MIRYTLARHPLGAIHCSVVGLDLWSMLVFENEAKAEPAG
jgi:hypothetical protein